MQHLTFWASGRGQVRKKHTLCTPQLVELCPLRRALKSNWTAGGRRHFLDLANPEARSRHWANASRDLLNGIDPSFVLEGAPGESEAPP